MNPSPRAARLWLIRHARPLIDAGICYGATDVPAEPAATRASAELLAGLFPSGIRVVVSPLRRCAALAEELRRLRPDLRYASDARLAEMDFGCWEGKRWTEIPESAVDEWTAQFRHFRFGGAECVQELMDRVAGAWADTQAAGLPAAWITHAGVIRAATLLAQGITMVERSEQWPRTAPAFGGYLALDASALRPA